MLVVPRKTLSSTITQIKGTDKEDSFYIDEEQKKYNNKGTLEEIKSEKETTQSRHSIISDRSLKTSNKLSSLRKSRLSLTVSDEESLSSSRNASMTKFSLLREKLSQTSPELRCENQMTPFSLKQLNKKVDANENVGLRSKYASNTDVNADGS